MGIWNNKADVFGPSTEKGFTIQIETSMFLIAIIGLMATQADAVLSPAAACCAARGHVGTLRTVTRALSRVANLLLIYGALMENGSLIQIYLWYTLAFIVLGFPVALVDFLLSLKHDESWSLPDFLSEVVLLFVLSQCLPLVDTYRKQISEPKQVKYSD